MSHYNSQKGTRPVSKVKGYQATTISMSRKSSLKISKSFLKQPTQVHKHKGVKKLRLARSNDSQNNDSKISERSYRHNKILRKRRKQPSESIETSRGQTHRGVTLRMFNATSKPNLSLNTSLASNKANKPNVKNPKTLVSNVSHSEIKVVEKRAAKHKASSTICGITFDHSETTKRPKLLNGSMFPRRASGLTRPKTSIGRNHTIYGHSHKFNNSCIENKPSIDHFLTNRSNSEQSKVEILGTEPSKNPDDTVERLGEELAQEQQRLSKNYSLKTIFEKKRLNSKDFIRDNINYVNKLSSKVKNK